MWELFEGYRNKCKQTPIKKMVFVGKDGSKEWEERERPLTMEGFECYVLEFTELTYPDLTSYFEGKGSYQNFLPICSRIRRMIREDQICGGMAGIYNHSITQRLNGLTEKVEQTNIEQPLFPNSSKENQEKP